MNFHLSRTTAFLTLLILLVGTPERVATASGEAEEAAQLTLQDLRTFTDVFEQLRRNYIEEIDDKTLLQAAMRGMVSETTDGYSAFIDEEEFRVLDSVSRGESDSISVHSEWAGPNIAYLGISHFHQDTHLEFREKLKQFQRPEGAPLAGIILDLRGNLGGTLQSAVAIADGFLDDGMIVNTRSRYPATQLEFHAHPGQWVDDTPLAVLVDRSTASASEVLAGALRDHGRARIIGQQTYGKGSIQSILHLRNGSALKLTTALYFTPSGQSLQGQGIEPDITTGEGEDAREQALDSLQAQQAGFN